MNSSPIERFNVKLSGDGTVPLVLLHGLGCDQRIWQSVAPAFAADYRLVLLDQMGAGASDTRHYDRERYGDLHGYADDLVQVLDALALEDAVLVGHSVSGIIAMLAALKRPERVARLVMICSSARYLNDPPHYAGGYDDEVLAGLMELMEKNYLDWAGAITRMAIGEQPTPRFREDLEQHFLATDPAILRQFAKVVFYSDTRAYLPRLPIPAKVMQTRHDAIVPLSAAEFLQRELPEGELVMLECRGHYPQTTAPAILIDALRHHLGSP